ncbi:glycosyltransferase family 2 protein [Candidatus Erwinia dacicola]|uniref:Glycosyl transferase 2 family protein n=1 Tax=Candidatus Erwinia dacicola TaxID=252393 RepID=A0A1E7Z023_9GAMM|nr:glycosyltransferase family 2 protein [Candidatus Erwinia dacicola]NJD00911.1 glycosyltransferase family 2 protein [Candidatus Erwinia dacicola]NJD85661.1 glycosyltransferase family 2 protein [Candidatus Erwinia dacicola]OFC62064.1 glycosyl transferase family 2 [Candidatus Erwinia dacicola]RAP71090.1 glycosyl transferase 2 family protein [Candidatus Erwinia dacicola]
MEYIVSIIMPTFNSKLTIVDTLRSVFDQSITDWELIITDDCSIDGTYELLSKISINEPRIKLFANGVNSGAAVSRNNSLSKAKGKFIAFLDSDDLWLPNKLEEQVTFMGDNIDFSFTAYELISDEGKKLNINVDTHQVSPLGYQDMLKKKATLGCSTVILRRAVFPDLTMPLLRTGQDYALWLKILKLDVKAVPYNKVLTQYRIMPGSISRNKFKKSLRQWEIYRRVEGLGVIYSCWCFSFYAWRAVFRK